MMKKFAKMAIVALALSTFSVPTASAIYNILSNRDGIITLANSPEHTNEREIDAVKRVWLNNAGIHMVMVCRTAVSAADEDGFRRVRMVRVAYYHCPAGE